MTRPTIDAQRRADREDDEPCVGQVWRRMRSRDKRLLYIVSINDQKAVVTSVSNSGGQWIQYPTARLREVRIDRFYDRPRSFALVADSGNHLVRRALKPPRKYGNRTAKARGISHDQLLRELHYDPETGLFTRLVSRGHGKAGTTAGSLEQHGYVSVCVLGCTVRAHRLAWFYVHGAWPAAEIDHINRNPRDNRLANLREATHSQNLCNLGINAANKSGYRGVSRSRRGWQAHIAANGKRRALGYFKTKEEAHAAYVKAARELHGEFIGAVSTECSWCRLNFERFRDPWTNQFYHTQGGEETPCERENVPQ